MLSIVLIAAALLIAALLMLPMRGAAAARAENGAKTLSGISPAGAVRPMQMVQQSHGPEIVALVLHVPHVDCACEKAKKFAEQTFLVADAPKLPFSDCGRVDCRCRYERIANRRKGERRTHSDRRDAIRFEFKDDRRVGKDRRKTNNLWKQPV